MSVFTPPYNPSYGSGDDFDFRMMTNSFGDGYKQDTPDGLNNIVNTQNLQWNKCSDDVANDIIAQIKSFNGTAFEWTTVDGELKTWTCQKISRQRAGYRTCDLTLTFVEDFST